MRFFFLDEPPPVDTGAWTAPRELSQHLRALRFAAHEPFQLVDATQRAWVAVVSADGVLELRGRSELEPLPLVPITLFTAWPKGKRAETLVTRAVEAGVQRVVLMSCERSIAGKEALSRNQSERLYRLVREVSQQVGNPVQMQIEAEPRRFASVIREARASKKLVLHPNGSPLLEQVPSRFSDPVSLLVGPEGGFSDQEVEEAQAHDWRLAGIGPLILRIEAAGPSAAASLQLQRSR